MMLGELASCGTAELLEPSGTPTKFKGKSFSIRQVVLMLSSQSTSFCKYAFMI